MRRVGLLLFFPSPAARTRGCSLDVYASGALIDGIYGFGPLSGAAANVTLFSYRGACGIAVNTDQAAVPDPDVFRACLEEGITQVLGLA